MHRTKPVFLILPAVLLGVFAMVTGGISPFLWGQQIAATLLFSLLLLVEDRAVRRIPRKAWLCALVLALFAALLFPGAGGARRWLDLGPLSVNAAMLALPALLVLLGGMENPLPALLPAAAALCLQPDLSQLCALSLAALPLLIRRHKKPTHFFALLALLAALCVLCALRPVSLEPADYSEGVLLMLGSDSFPLLALGVFSLMLVPGFFCYRFLRTCRMPLLCLSVYYAAVILFGVSGDYPSPFMGFGLSPIAGYALAMLLLRAQEAQR